MQTKGRNQNEIGYIGQFTYPHERQNRWVMTRVFSLMSKSFDLYMPWICFVNKTRKSNGINNRFDKGT